MTELLRKKPRRKWAFKDRETAEAVAAERWSEVNRLQRVVNAMTRAEVRWVDVFCGDETGFYRFGYVPGRGETVFLYGWNAENEGQKESVEVLSEDRARELLAKLERQIPAGKLEWLFRDGLRKCWNEGMKS